jgi:hypothetical protein
MAIKINFKTVDNFGNDVVLPKTYCRVSMVVGTKLHLVFDVEMMNETKDQLFITQKYNFAPSVELGSANFIEQAYNHLKTLPDYASAIDC